MFCLNLMLILTNLSDQWGFTDARHVRKMKKQCKETCLEKVIKIEHRYWKFKCKNKPIQIRDKRK